MPCKPLLSLLALSFGFLGVVACGVGIAAVWSVGSRLTRTNEKVFDGTDESLATVRDRVLDAQRRVQESEISTEDVERGLRNWTRRRTSERVESRLEVEEKAKQLVLALQQVDLWLELSGASFQSVQQVLEVGSSIGAPVDATLVDPLLGKLASLQSQLKQTIETVDGIRERAVDVASSEERIEQAVQLALRVVATLGSIDSRLEKFENRLSETQKDLQGLKTKTRRWILVVTIGITLLIVWMAAGQVALCLLAWNGLRRTGRPLDEEKPAPQSAGEGSE